MAQKKQSKPGNNRFSQQDIELQSMVKRANQRLRELERQGLQNAPAYKAAERLAMSAGDIMGRTRNNEIKFSTNLRSLSLNQRSQLRSEVKRFLGAITSTTKGVKETFEKMKRGYENASPGVDFSGVDLGESLNIWNTAIVDQYKRMYGSDFTKNMVDMAMTNEDSLDDMEQFLMDQYGKPISTIIEDLEASEDFEPVPWSWEDIFGDGTPGGGNG